ncbi:putative repeat protein (TIGR01451 family) [Methanohalophilus euhalobius]|uniref:Conserved repeat domain-containing protein n=1 Tax=Methanohalophilus euhalobius TaxID=51203 RepID=A0A285GCT0_9EURY|nr:MULTISPECIES: BatD family protein [Methanohalophilus]ODV50214.1 MAG: conserved repeat domain protein [Methanohalophilus sp. 2-GBenrich]TCL12119.1 putative repeat protein (TIGR01451 family) [Methanohalophilus euhalobius]SNY21265.1 conserved repeat domain-containing protein [Methanohalophilus euhalobius]
MEFKKMIVCLLLIAALSSVAFVGSASAKSVLYEGEIQAGDGYQINNHVIDVADVFPSNEYASFYVYEKDTELMDKGLDINDTFTFEIDNEEVEVKLLDTKKATLNLVNILITITDEDIINTKGVVDGGHEKAEFSGTPIIEITKSASSNTIQAGDSVTVTVSAENKGDDEATDLRFSNNLPEKFILEETFVSQSGKMSLSIGESQQIFVYRIKSTEPGTFTLKPTTATFSNNAGVDFPQASSNTPTITVEGEPAAMADVEVSAELQEPVIPRGESTEVTLLIRNNGEGGAEAVSVDIQLPDGLEYESGDSEIEIISGTPTIYLQTLGVQQEKEFTFNVKAEEMGSYPVTASYSYISTEDPEAEKVNSETTTNALEVTKGKYDVIFEQPLYVYIVPVVIILGAAAWIYYRRQQYRF